MCLWRQKNKNLIKYQQHNLSHPAILNMTKINTSEKILLI